MRIIKHRNVNRAFQHGLHIVSSIGVLEETRNGPALVVPEPLTTVYSRPWERVLFSKSRKANPFFHLFESFWMLAGRSDAAFLDNFVRDFGSRYAEQDGHLHGAYGNRWIHWWKKNQLEGAIDVLLRNPASRQAVISMWDPDEDLGGAYKDIPCNDIIFLRIMGHDLNRPKLHMTVCCRSNDAIWGAYGANCVHFSILQEYLAWRLDTDVGPLTQVSNNFHAYVDTMHLFDKSEADHDLYSTEEVRSTPLFLGWEPGASMWADAADPLGRVDVSIYNEIDLYLNDPGNRAGRPFAFPMPFRDLLVPMFRAHGAARRKQWAEAADWLSQVAPLDWRRAGEMWIGNRRHIAQREG